MNKEFDKPTNNEREIVVIPDSGNKQAGSVEADKGTTSSKYFTALLLVVMLCLLFQANLARNGISLGLGGDADDYIPASEAIMKGDFYNAKVPFAYPLFLGVTRQYGDNAVLLAQFLLALASPIIMFVVAHRATNSPLLSMVLAVLSFIYYDNTIYTFYVMAEPLARFLATCWAGSVFLYCLNKNGGKFWLWFSIIPLALLSCTKSQFFYILLLTYITVWIMKAIPRKIAIISIVTISIVPLYFNITSAIAGKGVIHRQNDFLYLTTKLLLADDNYYRLEAYPKGDPVIDSARELAKEAKGIDHEMNPKFAEPLIAKYAKAEGISDNEAMERLSKVYLKVFLRSLIYRPAEHIRQLTDWTIRTMDRLPVPENEPITATVRRYVRYAIERATGFLFLLSIPFSIGLVLLYFTGSIDKKESGVIILLPVFFFGYMLALHYVNTFGRHRIPIHDIMFFIDLAFVHFLFYGRKKKTESEKKESPATA